MILKLVYQYIPDGYRDAVRPFIRLLCSINTLGLVGEEHRQYYVNGPTLCRKLQ
jgi:hypothetical protein